MRGSGKYILNETEYDICENNIFMLTPVDFHQIIAASEVELMNISFDSEMMSDRSMSRISASNVKKAYRLDGEDLNRFWMALRLLQHECEIGGTCQKQLFAYVLECLLRNDPRNVADGGNTEQLMGIKRAILYLEMHFKEKITLSQLAEQAGYNPNYFSELFRRTTGETYIEKLNDLRANYACTLLANGSSVYDACFASGFGSLSNFLTIFKAKCGCSPSQYKKQHRKNK